MYEAYKDKRKIAKIVIRWVEILQNNFESNTKLYWTARSYNGWLAFCMLMMVYWLLKPVTNCKNYWTKCNDERALQGNLLAAYGQLWGVKILSRWRKWQYATVFWFQHLRMKANFWMRQKRHKSKLNSVGADYLRDACGKSNPNDLIRDKCSSTGLVT